MTSILLELAGAKATAVTTGTLTEGMVGVTVCIRCDSEWDGLIKTLVCESEAGKRVILNVGDTVVIPPELLRCWAYGPGRLMLGLEGRKPDGTVVIPSTWADAGMIMPGTDLNGDPTIAQENASWANLLQMIGSLNELKTTDRENLVAAINETLEKARGGTNGVAPRNLLDNSDFRDPVNQRGQSSYSSAYQYTIDRWRAASPRTCVTVETGYVSIRNTDPVNSDTACFEQIIPDKTIGQAYTLVVREHSSGESYLTSFTLPTVGTAAQRLGELSVGSGSISGVLLASGEFRVQFLVEGNGTIALDWAALYEGAYTAETLPEYRPRGYGAELLECQRYYQVRSQNGIAAVDMRPKMRLSSPTITAVTGGYAYSADL